MYTKEEFKQRFRAMDTEELILNASRPLTDEAMEATSEILAERGLTGDAAKAKTKEVIRAHLQGGGVTRHCDYCGKSLREGVYTVQGQKFCGRRCHLHSRLSVIALDFEPETIVEHAKTIRRGRCPRCHREGDIVEVRRVQRMVSVLVLSVYENNERINCRRCYEKELRTAFLISGLLGWWSISGLFRNLGVVWENFDAWGREDPAEPSEALLKYASLDLAQKMLARQQAA